MRLCPFCSGLWGPRPAPTHQHLERKTWLSGGKQCISIWQLYQGGGEGEDHQWVGWLLFDCHQGQGRLRRAFDVMTQTRWHHQCDLWERESGLHLSLPHLLPTDDKMEMHQLMPVKYSPSLSFKCTTGVIYDVELVTCHLAGAVLWLCDMLMKAEASYHTSKPESQIFKALQWPVNALNIVLVELVQRQWCVRLLLCALLYMVVRKCAVRVCSCG